MTRQHFWNDERLARLRSEALSGMFASDVAALFGVSKLSVLTVCAKHGIDIAKHTEAELAEWRAAQRTNEKRKRAKRVARSDISVAIGTSKTAPVYRNQLPRLPEMSKSALREMIAEAVRNTAGASL